MTTFEEKELCSLITCYRRLQLHKTFSAPLTATNPADWTAIRRLHQHHGPNEP